jgi:regulator of cell morphogenesis and NO signaling
MFLQPFEINRKSLVAEIVAKDYRTADVFRRYGIGYCCGGKWPMEMACELRGVDADKVQAELQHSVRTMQVSNQLDFAKWDLDFLMDYLVNVHHHYLERSLPVTEQLLTELAKEHTKKYPYLAELEKQFHLLVQQLLPSVQKEEEVIFPYIRQLAHAHKSKEPYAALFIRTLRKPVVEILFKGHEMVTGMILSIRQLTNQYNTPENTCTSHKVILAKLKELDNDLMQHLYLEQSVLFPRVAAIEKEVLNPS